jgi:hypothetical protein
MPTQDMVHSHSYQHFEDLQISSNEFYALLESKIREYRYPDVSCSRQTQREGGLFSAKREYLAVSWKRYVFHVCASPFGRSFFISWWLHEGANSGANAAARIPLIGKALARNMESKTYYQQDAELMFTNSINSIIKVTVEKVKAEYGFRTAEAAN